MCPERIRRVPRVYGTFPKPPERINAGSRGGAGIRNRVPSYHLPERATGLEPATSSLGSCGVTTRIRYMRHQDFHSRNSAPIGSKQRMYRLRWALVGTMKQAVHPRSVSGRQRGSPPFCRSGRALTIRTHRSCAVASYPYEGAAHVLEPSGYEPGKTQRSRGLSYGHQRILSE